MSHEAPGTLVAGAKIQYLCKLVCGELFHQLDTFSADVGSTTLENLKSIILGLGTYLLPVNVLSKRKHTIRHGMRNSQCLHVRCYAAHLLDLNKYLFFFPWERASEFF